MLDILRKHASSWIIKAMLAAIVISFVFFFGWSTFRKGMAKPSDAVGSVNGVPIAASEFRFLYDRNFERLKASFKEGEMPEFLQRMAAQGTLEQLVYRTLMLSTAEQLGAVVPDGALAAAIRDTAAAQRDGAFDLVFYKEQYLPYFKQRFGIDYEEFISQEIMVEDLRSMFGGISLSPPFPEEKGAEWTFEVVELDPDALKDTFKSPDEARSFAAMLIATEPARWRDNLRGLGVSLAKAGPMTISQRNELLGGRATFEDQREIFSLTEAGPVIKSPIERGGIIYVVRLASTTRTPAAAAAAPADQDFLRAWMEQLREKAVVRSFLDKGE